jgi:hypothetical protein
MLNRIPSVRLELVEQSACVWQAQLTVDLPKGYRISVVLADEKLIEATTSKPSGITLTFRFELSAESLSIRLTDPDGEIVLLDNGYLHLANRWNREYAHAEIRHEMKTGKLCPYVVFMDDKQQLPTAAR